MSEWLHFYVFLVDLLRLFAAGTGFDIVRFLWGVLADFGKLINLFLE